MRVSCEEVGALALECGEGRWDFFFFFDFDFDLFFFFLWGFPEESGCEEEEARRGCRKECEGSEVEFADDDDGNDDDSEADDERVREEARDESESELEIELLV